MGKRVDIAYLSGGAILAAAIVAGDSPHPRDANSAASQPPLSRLGSQPATPTRTASNRFAISAAILMRLSEWPSKSTWTITLATGAATAFSPNCNPPKDQNNQFDGLAS
jgi:hypothetical protein